MDNIRSTFRFWLNIVKFLLKIYISLFIMVLSVSIGSCNDSMLSITIIRTIVDNYPSISNDVTIPQWVNPPSRILCSMMTIRALKYIIFISDTWMSTILFHTTIITTTMSSDILYSYLHTKTRWHVTPVQINNREDVNMYSAFVIHVSHI